MDDRRVGNYFELFQIVALVVIVYSVAWGVLLLGHLLLHSLQALVTGLKHIPVAPKRQRRH